MKNEAAIRKMEIPGFKNSPTIYFNPSTIENYAYAPDYEKNSFLHILEYPVFCGNEGDSGIKQIKFNPPHCTLSFTHDDETKNFTLNVPIKYEMKLKGTSKEGRVGLCEIKTDSKIHPVVLVATHYVEKGFHSSKSVNKKYHASLKNFGLFANPIKPDDHLNTATRKSIKQRTRMG
jgi:hypothetical protein